jgi:DNA-directed RNA polymerase subunit RPC12/RpoP
MTLKSISQHEAETWESFEAQRKLNEPHPNGLACPKCGAELWDSNPMIVLASYPPQKNVHCPSCNYRTSIVR